MKRNNISPAKGNEAAAYEGRRHTVRAARRTALYSAVKLGVRVGEGVGSEGVRSTRGDANEPKLAVAVSLLAQKSHTKLHEKHPYCLKKKQNTNPQAHLQ